MYKKRTQMEGAGGKEAGMKQNQGAPEKAPLQLSEEEKAVLMECRRNSTARGRWAWPPCTRYSVVCRSSGGCGFARPPAGCHWLRCASPSPESLLTTLFSCRQSATARPAMVFTVLHGSWGGGVPGWPEVVQRSLSGQDHGSGALCSR